MRKQWNSRSGLAVLGAAAVLLSGLSSTARATQAFDQQRGVIQARVSTQNTFQHHDAESIDWVQWRNELRFDLTYDVLRRGQEFGPISLFKFNLLWRGRVDPTYQLKERYRSRDYDREDFMFPEGSRPRELFVDVGFGGALKDLSMRIGRQQVVWGEADLFRSIDVVNPLRLDQNGFLGEDFADFREPLWIWKFLYNIGSLGPIGDAGLEWFYSPNSRPQNDRPVALYGDTWRINVTDDNILDGFKRNHTLPFRQVRAPWEIGRVGTRHNDSPATVQNADGTFSDFVYQIHSDTSSSEFDVKKNSMAGVRLLGSTFGNINFTLNYLFKRSDPVGSAIVFEDIFDPAAPGTGAVKADVLGRAVGAASTADLNGNGLPDGMEQQIRNCLNKRSPELILTSVYSDPAHPERATGAKNVSYRPNLPIAGDGNATSTGCLAIPLWHPWTHIIGLTGTYNDFEYTGLVFRLEQSLSTKEPRNGSAPQSPDRQLQQIRTGGAYLAVPQARDFDTHNMRTTQVWRSMIGFDSLKSVAPRYGRTMPQPLRSLLTDQWALSFQFLNEYYAHADHVNSQTSFTNRMHHWNPLFTLSGTGFFLQQRLRPLWAVALDISEKPFPVFLVQTDYFLTDRLAVRAGEILYAGSKNNETNSGLHFYADRDTTFVRLTWYFV